MDSAQYQPKPVIAVDSAAIGLFLRLGCYKGFFGLSRFIHQFYSLASLPDCHAIARNDSK